MINTTKRYKKGNALIDKSKEQNVWVYHQKSESVVLVSTDPNFNSADDMYEANTGDLMNLRQNHSKSIKSKVKGATNEEKEAKNGLNAFFDSLVVPERCQECGDRLMAFNKFAKRSCCAHLLPKFKFESIATNELNILFMGADFLGGCSCHDCWDKSVSNRKKMEVYPLALQRYELLKEFLTNAEIVSADKYLGL